MVLRECSQQSMLLELRPEKRHKITEGTIPLGEGTAGAWTLYSLGLTMELQEASSA